MAALLLLPLMAGGCLLPGEGSRDIVLSPVNRPIQFEQTFDEAYAAPSPDGGYDLVLSSGYQSESPSAGRRLYPVARSHVGQVMHIHVSWRPARGIHSDFPAATNTTVDWYVFTEPGSETPSYIRYAGIGYTALEFGDTITLFSLRDLTIHPATITGKSSDPLGESRLAGKIRATNDAPRVAAILQKLQQDTAGAEPRTTERPLPQPSGMPPARHQGP